MAMLAGRLIGSAAVMIAYRRSPPLKIVFNLSLVVSEVCLALTIFRALAPDTPGAGPATWLAAYAAAFAADVMGVVAISCAIAARDGAVDLRALFSGAGSLKVPALAVTLGLICVVSLTGMRESAWLLLGFGVLLLLAFRTYASLAEKHLNLERLYRFSQAVSSSRGARRRHEQRAGRGQGGAAVRPGDGGVHRPGRRPRGPGAAGRGRAADPVGGTPDSGGRRWVLRQVVDEADAAAHAAAHPRCPRRGAGSAQYEMRDAVIVPLNGPLRHRRSARRRRPARRHHAPSTTTTRCCSRPSPTTPASRCATASSSASCGTTPCTTPSPGCPTGRTCSAGSPPR